MKSKRQLSVLAMILCVLFLAGCMPPGMEGAVPPSGPVPEDSPVSVITAAPVPSGTPVSTAVPEATELPTEVPAATDPHTAAPALTATPEPDYLWEEKNSYAGYSLSVPWPSGKDSYHFSVITHTDSIAGRVACMSAVRETLNKMYGEEHLLVGYTHPETAEQSVAALASRVASASLNLPNRMDGILIFPIEGADYTEALETAVQNGVPVWVFSSEMPSVICEELLALLAEDERPALLYSDYEINLPWPDMDSGIRIGVVFGRHNSEYDLSSPVMDSLRKAYGYGNYRAVPTFEEMGDTCERFRYLISYGREDGVESHDPVDAILLFPAVGTDYSQEIEKATQAGIPVWVFGGEEADTVEAEILALHKAPAATPGREPASLRYPTAYTDYSLNCPWPSGKAPSIVLITREEHTLYSTVVEGNCHAAVREGLREAYPDLLYKQSFMVPDNGLVSAVCVMDRLSFHIPDAILLFPYDDVDYGFVLDRAALKGVPVWVFSSVDPAVIRQEIVALVR